SDPRPCCSVSGAFTSGKGPVSIPRATAARTRVAIGTPGCENVRVGCRGTSEKHNRFDFSCPGRRPVGRLDFIAPGFAIMSEWDEDRRWAERAGAGDGGAAGEALPRHRTRLRRMVEARLDRRVRGRVDPSDVLQDGFVDAVAKLPGYLADPKFPLFLWLRL